MPVESNSRSRICPGCDRGMKLVQTIPQLGALSEIVVLYCEQCKHAETIAKKRGLAHFSANWPYQTDGPQ
jgi:hypothetical protein